MPPSIALLTDQCVLVGLEGGGLERGGLERRACCPRLLEAATQIRRLEQGLAQARREASTDPLTGLANRRAFDSAARALADEAEANGTPIAMLMIDIDHFKRINDHHGHATGDAVLRDVSAHVCRIMRRTDVVARHGGEEFAALLPGTSASGALVLAETVRDQVAGRHITCGSGLTLRVTVSIGAAAYEPREALEAWAARADAALYESKRSGRNRVSFGSAPNAALSAHGSHSPAMLANQG